MSDPIERLTDALRSPGRAGELQREALAVDALVAAVTETGASMNLASTTARTVARRPWRVASFLAAGVVGFGGVAAAGPGTFSAPLDTEAIVATIDDTVPDTTVPETTVPETTVPETTVPDTTVPETTTPETTVPPTTLPVAIEPDAGDEGPTPGPPDEQVDDPDTAFDETECVDGNHGKTVSSVARTEGRNSQDVVDAAKSACGKNGADESDDDDDDRDDDDDDRDDDDDDRDDDDDDRDDDDDDRDDDDDDRDDDDRDDDDRDESKTPRAEPAADDQRTDKGNGSGQGNGGGNGKGNGKGQND